MVTKNKLTAKYQAAIAVIVKDQTILMVQLPQWYAREPGKWVLPGGVVDPGETPDQTVTREVFEETNLRVEVVRELAVIEESEFMNVHFFECRYVDGIIKHQAEELAAAEWVRIPELSSREIGYNNLINLQEWGYI